MHHLINYALCCDDIFRTFTMARRRPHRARCCFFIEHSAISKSGLSCFSKGIVAFFARVHDLLRARRSWAFLSFTSARGLWGARCWHSCRVARTLLHWWSCWRSDCLPFHGTLCCRLHVKMYCKWTRQKSCLQRVGRTRQVRKGNAWHNKSIYIYIYILYIYITDNNYMHILITSGDQSMQLL